MNKRATSAEANCGKGMVMKQLTKGEVANDDHSDELHLEIAN